MPDKIESLKRAIERLGDKIESLKDDSHKDEDDGSDLEGMRRCYEDDLKERGWDVELKGSTSEEIYADYDRQYTEYIRHTYEQSLRKRGIIVRLKGDNTDEIYEDYERHFDESNV